MFKAALSVMGDLYASALGTSVLQLQEVPPQPDDWPALEIYNARPYFERGWVSLCQRSRVFQALTILIPRSPSLPRLTTPVPT